MSEKRRDRFSAGLNFLPDFAFEEIEKVVDPLLGVEESFFVRTDDPGYLQPTLDHRGIRYRVLPKNRVSWKLPPEPLGYESEEKLFDEVKEFLFHCYDLREEGAYDVWAGTALASQRIEDFDTCPYLCFLGPRRTGKSTALRVSKQIFRRCIGGPALSAAWIASVIDRYDASVVFDEMQLWKSDDKSEHLAILRGGYQRDMPRYKMILAGKNFTDIEQKIFGIKLIACEVPVEPGIMERCIVFHTSKRTRETLKLRRPEFRLRGSELRGRLLSYRFRHLGQAIPEEIEDELNEIKDDRLQELAFPILASTPLNAHDTILRFFKEQVTRLTSEEQTGEWADYVRAIADCVAQGKVHAGNVIMLRDLRDSLMRVTETKEEKWLDSPKKNRRILDSLAFKRARTNEGVGFYYDAKLQSQLAERFTLSPVEPSQATQATFEKGTPEREVKLVQDVKDSKGYSVDERFENVELLHPKVKRGLRPEAITCPRCHITYPDQPSFESHLLTYKHDTEEILPEGEAGGLTDSDYDRES